jgi:hypothetical protein
LPRNNELIIYELYVADFGHGVSPRGRVEDVNG